MAKLVSLPEMVGSSVYSGLVGQLSRVMVVPVLPKIRRALMNEAAVSLKSKEKSLQ